METIKFYTVGCKVNQYETQLMREQFLRRGFKELEDSESSDIYVINTCTVTHKADSDSFSFIHKAKRENPKAKIIVTGCLVELDEDKIKKINRSILTVKNKDKNKIVDLLDGRTEKQKDAKTEKIITYFKTHTRAFLKIQDGCNNFCSYCKVPLVRGRSRSRNLGEILEEAKALVENGYKEIVLCGICLGAYGKDLKPEVSLLKVIKELEKINGLLRIRLSSLEAEDITDELIEYMGTSEKLCSHLHIPLQSGDDEILKKMNRKYSQKNYLRLIKKIKKKIPEVAITTDILVGFPTETEKNFQNTLNLVKEILPLKVHIFAYSSRPQTPAFNFKEKVNPKIIKKRQVLLKKIAQKCSLIYKKQFLNQTKEVLFENNFKSQANLWQGYTDNYLRVLVKSNNDLKNQIIPVKLNKIKGDFILAHFF